MNSNSNRTTEQYNEYLTVENCPITGEDVARYWGREIPDYDKIGLKPDAIYYVYRPLDELKDTDFCNKPLLLQHRDFSADDYNAKFVCGTIGETRLENDQLLATVVYWSQKSQELLNKNMKYLSCGYTYTPVLESGVHEGKRYDVKMTNILASHVAMVDNPRYKKALVPDSAFNLDNFFKKVKLMNFLKKRSKKQVYDSDTMSYDEAIETTKAIMSTDSTPEEKDMMIQELKNKLKLHAEGENLEQKALEGVEDEAEESKVKEIDKDAGVISNTTETTNKEPLKQVIDIDTIEQLIKKRVDAAIKETRTKATVFDSALSDYNRLCGRVSSTVFDSADAVYDKILKNYGHKSEGKTLEQKQAMTEMLTPNKIKIAVFDNSSTDSLISEDLQKLLDI